MANPKLTTATAIPAIEVDHLTVSYGAVPALLDVSVRIPAGKLVGVIGPNGSGKSTLIKTILGFLRPDVGQVRIFGQPAELRKGRVAYVPQRGAVDWDFPITVREVALMGRYGHVRWWRDLSREDRRLADEALQMVRMSELADRQIGQLSGGQQQRVFMARRWHRVPTFCCWMSLLPGSTPPRSKRFSTCWSGPNVPAAPYWSCITIWGRLRSISIR